MLINMLKILFTSSLLWSWFLVFPVSVGMEWSTSAASQPSTPSTTSETREYKEVTGCTSITSIGTPKHFLAPLFQQQSSRVEPLKITVSLGKHFTEKGCGHNTYDQVQRYKKCGLQENVALLPVHEAAEEPFVKLISKQVTPAGSLDYVFDGGTAVRYPTKQLPTDWSKSYTMSGWIYVNPHQKDRQYILSWSDGDTPYRQNMGLYVQRFPDSLSFGFSHTHIQNDNLCLVRKKWTIDVKEITWHFFSLTFSACSVEFSLDGQKLVPTPSLSHLHVPEKHIQPKFVIGARWAGSVVKYADYLDGSISGLILTVQSKFNQKAIDCILECTESLSVFFNLPSIFMKTVNAGKLLSIVGSGNRKQFEDIMDDIIYTNNNKMPLQDERTLEVIVENTQENKIVQRSVTVRTNRPKPKIVIEGSCRYDSHKQLSKTSSVRLCADLTVYTNGCDGFLDSLTVTSSQLLEKTERLFIPPAYINRFQLNVRATERGFTVYGVASVEDYSHLMKQLRYSHNGASTDVVTKTFEVTVSSYNGLAKSNTFIIDFEASILSIATGHQVKKLITENEMETRDGYIVDITAHETLMGGLPQNKMVSEEKKRGIGFIIFAVVGSIFGVFVVIPMLVIGFTKLKSGKSQGKTVTRLHHDSPSRDRATSAVYFFDGDESPCIKINPSERVSISNDPFVDILLQKPSVGETSTTDGSVYSDDDDESDFDNDSIRQLEWDCLEKNLTNVLDGDEKSSTQGSRLGKGESIPEEVFL